jgi:hypothetical protein
LETTAGAPSFCEAKGWKEEGSPNGVPSEKSSLPRRNSNSVVTSQTLQDRECAGARNWGPPEKSGALIHPSCWRHGTCRTRRPASSRLHSPGCRLAIPPPRRSRQYRHPASDTWPKKGNNATISCTLLHTPTAVSP